MIGTGLPGEAAEARVMDGVHDMGGMDGFGKVVPEQNEPVFHEAWESRVMAMNRAMGAAGAWNIDMARFSREALPPRRLPFELVLRAVAAGDGAATRSSAAWSAPMSSPRVTRSRPGKPLGRGKFTTADVGRVLSRGSFERPAPAPARFAPGDAVRARNIHPSTHTRLPRYVRGHAGIVERIQGCHVFPDASALGQARRRSGCTRSASRVASCGATKPIRRSGSRSRRSSRIWSPA